MAPVVTPINPELRDLALRLAPPEACTPEALEAAKGQEHLLTDAGFTAHVAHLLDMPCLSPGGAGTVADIANRIDAQLATLGETIPQEYLTPMVEYLRACRLVAHVAAFQQEFLLAYLHQGLVDRPLADRIGVPLEQLDMSIKLLKFGRKNSDGTPWLTGTEWR
jgi:hypothetical protein